MRRLLAIAWAAASAAAHAQLPETAQAWREAALRDIAAGYQVTLGNHAGALDPHNPAFLADLKAAREHGLALARQVKDAPGYVATLQGFTARINDGHAGIATKGDLLPAEQQRWPGFVPAWRDDLYVYASEPGGPPAGARIVSCDGRPARRLMEENVFAFQGRGKEAGQWWSRASELFVDRGNPFIALPERCVFATAEGAQTERVLEWRRRTEQAREWAGASVGMAELPVGLTEPRPKLFWAAMPTFHPNDAERAAYHAMADKIRQERARLLQADAVVIDLRGNQGGSSMWSQEVAGALWGEARLKRRRDAYDGNTVTWYRPSPGNLAYFRMYQQKFAQQGEQKALAWATRHASGMAAAQTAGQPYYIDREDGQAAPADAQADRPGDPPAFTRPVYVIVPGYCASACLDALDTFKLFPNTRLVGAPSSADSTYMEVRSQDLPGGLARVIVPMKLYVGRPRGNGQFYQPDIPLRTVGWGTAEFLRLIEQQLGK
ncbi:S41 family peptidase [Pseudoduganella armeniaca]|uniref:Tail specific protease domain-containing protein n=1 Tax=Pseudoduganella armeniaca TaxID=2072590 RepID=A0A2R4CFG5_9BURK|nr:S41 family peptidase [Pseudoduganella armeniaca]AVR98369.1 hypothetical protein C9I28_24050 [Pseudoduganella armeniaca]